jgi:hypothetical protein
MGPGRLLGVWGLARRVGRVGRVVGLARVGLTRAGLVCGINSPPYFVRTDSISDQPHRLSAKVVHALYLKGC